MTQYSVLSTQQALFHAVCILGTAVMSIACTRQTTIKIPCRKLEFPWGRTRGGAGDREKYRSSLSLSESLAYHHPGTQQPLTAI